MGSTPSRKPNAQKVRFGSISDEPLSMANVWYRPGREVDEHALLGFDPASGPPWWDGGRASDRRGRESRAIPGNRGGALRTLTGQARPPRVALALRAPLRLSVTSIASAASTDR